MSQEVQTNDGATPEFNEGAEAQAYAELQTELDNTEYVGSPEPGPTDTGSTTETATEPAAETQGNEQSADAGSERAKPDPETLIKQYQGGMYEERQKRQAAEQRLQAMQQAIQEARQAQQQQQTPQDQPPSIDEDPIAYFEHQNRVLQDQVKQQQQFLDQQTQERQQQQQLNQFQGALTASEDQFAQQTPDYYDAAQHLRSVRMGQLEQLYPSTPQGDAYAQQYGFASASQMREAHVSNEAAMYAEHAFGMGRNPAEVFYELAKQNGYSVAQQVTPQQKTEMARAGVQRAQSLSGGGGNGGGDAGGMTQEELAQLAIEDPAAFDAAWEKMSNAGLLG